MIYGCGELDCGMSEDYAQLVMDNELIRCWRQAVQGIPVNDYTLSMDVIKNVGPRGNYLAEENTIQYLHSQSDSFLFNRGPRENWEAAGKPTMDGLAKERAMHILETHKPMPLPAGVEEKMAEIIKEAESIYCKKK